MFNKPAILLVDDEPSCLQVLTSALGTTEYQLICAVKAADALKLAREREPYVVLLDVKMGEMDGFELCHHLRADTATRDVPIIFLSSLNDPKDRTKGIEIGAVDFITKPFDPAEVRARVRRQVQLQQERRWLRAPVPPEARIKQIISEGENDRTEFKSTLRWSLKENKIDHGVEIAWLKTVAAFLNSDGGNLVVGVDDKGIPVGIEPDGFENEDKYLLHVNNRLQQHIGAEHSANVRFGLFPVGGLKVLLLECSPCSKPVFLVDGGQESFYVRTGPGTRKLTMSQMLSYVVECGRI
jgi:DNA-binding response OmpR family regulator